MTTSAARKRRSEAGFTLLEIVFVLVIMMLIAGGAMGVMYVNRDEAKLRNAMGEIELLAKRARTVASLQQRPYALEFTRDGVGLMPLAEATVDPRTRERMIEDRAFEDRAASFAAERGGESYEPPQSTRDSWQPEDSMDILVKRWASTKWVQLEARDRQVWRFEPDGICEPLGVRLELENGNWASAFFHPLTATRSETRSEIR